MLERLGGLEATLGPILFWTTSAGGKISALGMTAGRRPEPPGESQPLMSGSTLSHISDEKQAAWHIVGPLSGISSAGDMEIKHLVMHGRCMEGAG